MIENISYFRHTLFPSFIKKKPQQQQQKPAMHLKTKHSKWPAVHSIQIKDRTNCGGVNDVGG